MPLCNTTQRFIPLVKWSAQATLLAVSLLLSSCGEKPAEKSVPHPGVLVQAVTHKEISGSVKFIGRTMAINDVSVRSRVDGYLLERNFEEGGDIHKGDLLFKIDPETYEAALAAAKGTVAEHRAALTRADKDLVRFKELGEKAFASQQDASTGELAHVVELDPIYATFNVSEKAMLDVQQHKKVKNQKDPTKVEVNLELPNGAIYGHSGIIDFADNTVNRRTGAMVIRARFDNPDKLLVPPFYAFVQGMRERVKGLSK